MRQLRHVQRKNRGYIGQRLLKMKVPGRRRRNIIEENVVWRICRVEVRQKRV